MHIVAQPFLMRLKINHVSFNLKHQTDQLQTPSVILLTQNQMFIPIGRLWSKPTVPVTWWKQQNKSMTSTWQPLSWPSLSEELGSSCFSLVVAMGLVTFFGFQSTCYTLPRLSFCSLCGKIFPVKDTGRSTWEMYCVNRMVPTRARLRSVISLPCGRCLLWC